MCFAPKDNPAPNAGIAGAVPLLVGAGFFQHAVGTSAGSLFHATRSSLRQLRVRTFRRSTSARRIAEIPFGAGDEIEQGQAQMALASSSDSDALRNGRA